MVRSAMKIFGKDTVCYFPANCLLVFGATYPMDAFKVPYLHVLFENSAVCAAGIKRGLKKIGKPDVNVVAFAGDGGTADIGFQALSGAAERNEDIIYICYDNEAYMNTGIQRSGSTPHGAWTTTTPVGDKIKGKERFKKDIPRIMIAHDVLQIFAPCPTGWRFDPAKTIQIAKMAVDCGMWTLYESEDGKVTINKKPKMTPVKDYLKLQGRFRHLTDEQIAKKWERDSNMVTE
jgi:pyruvate ferredoxin oxidoreductase beta subunit